MRSDVEVTGLVLSYKRGAEVANEEVRVCAGTRERSSLGTALLAVVKELCS